MDLEQLKKDTKEILVDVLGKSRLRQGQILVLGMSSSEVAGGRIGKPPTSILPKLLSRPC